MWYTWNSLYLHSKFRINFCNKTIYAFISCIKNEQNGYCFLFKVIFFIKKEKEKEKEEEEEEEVEWYYAIRVLDNRVKCDTRNYWVWVGVSNGWV